MLIFIGVYIDDIELASQSQYGLPWLKSQLMNKFNMKNLGKTKTIIG